MRLTLRKASGSLEYAALVAIIAGALVVMQVYVKRGLQGRLRDSTDQLGEQFSPYATTGKIETSITGYSTETTVDGTTNTERHQEVTLKREINTGSLDQERWGN